MHRCCPTCCPDHVSQTCTLQCPKVHHWRVSKVFHRWNSSSLILLQQRRQNNPLEEQVSERERVWERWSTCWKVLAGVRASTFEEKRVKSGGSFHLSARRRRRTGKNQPLGHLFILSLPLLFRFGFYSAVNVCARSFRPAGMYYGPNKRSRRIVYELLASPKSNKGLYFHRKLHFHFGCIWLLEQRQ